MVKYTAIITGTGTGDLTTALTIEDGNPVFVNGFILSAPTGSTITLASGNGSITYGTISMGTDSVTVSHVKFYAYAGLRISSTAADNTAIVFHSQAGR